MARPREFDEDAVLDAVMDTFWHYGYEATSAQDLVQATGLGRGSLLSSDASIGRLVGVAQPEERLRRCKRSRGKGSRRKRGAARGGGGLDEVRLRSEQPTTVIILSR